ncbi:MAG TPA: hypothetical protein VM008_11375 [Phycisphaerae bacterium]|nr:hypothetical protein [Phycisphaerae bacterium]
MSEATQFSIRDSRGNIYGPATMEAVRQWIREGRIVPGMFIAPERTTDWVEVSNHPALADLFTGQPLAYHSPGRDPLATLPAPVSRAPIELAYNRPTEQTNPLAIISLTTGILSVCSCGCCCNFLLAPIGITACLAFTTTALITGLLALRQIEDQPERYSGRPFALAGIILGLCNLMIAGATVVVVIVRSVTH